MGVVAKAWRNLPRAFVSYQFQSVAESMQQYPWLIFEVRSRTANVGGHIADVCMVVCWVVQIVGWQASGVASTRSFVCSHKLSNPIVDIRIASRVPRAACRYRDIYTTSTHLILSS